MESRGQFPQDKPQLLAIIDRYLSLPEEERIHFTFGKRLGIYQRLDDMKSVRLREHVAAEMRRVQASYPGRMEEIFHHLRSQIV
jgi:hypothetical protein